VRKDRQTERNKKERQTDRQTESLSMLAPNLEKACENSGFLTETGVFSIVGQFLEHRLRKCNVRKISNTNFKYMNV